MVWAHKYSPSSATASCSGSSPATKHSWQALQSQNCARSSMLLPRSSSGMSKMSPTITDSDGPLAPIKTQNSTRTSATSLQQPRVRAPSLRPLATRSDAASCIVPLAPTVWPWRSILYFPLQGCSVHSGDFDALCIRGKGVKGESDFNLKYLNLLGYKYRCYLSILWRTGASTAPYSVCNQVQGLSQRLTMYMCYHSTLSEIDAITALYIYICIYAYIYIYVCFHSALFSMQPSTRAITAPYHVHVLSQHLKRNWCYHSTIYIYIYMHICIYIYMYASTAPYSVCNQVQGLSQRLTMYMCYHSTLSEIDAITAPHIYIYMHICIYICMLPQRLIQYATKYKGYHSALPCTCAITAP